MKKLLLAAFLFMVINVHAQYLKVDNGIMYSSFHNKEDLPLLSGKKLTSYSFLLGADYLEKGWSGLSSQVGYIKIGGSETYPYLQEEYKHVSESGSFIHLNTTFRVFATHTGSRIFAGIGPYANILTSTKNFQTPFYNPYYSFARIHMGGRGEIGLTQDINKLRIGLLGTYMFGLFPTAISEGISLYNNSFSVMLTTGYRLR